ncbi:MAG: argininosuccinate lyase, partial [Erysipelotrichaceae bacterium]|nr:argininosuccinate lyase [Erysipelotrichaceae bacterium]
SILFDQRLYHEDIMGSHAHANMLAKQGIISKEDNAKIQKGLQDIEWEIEAGKILLDLRYEDIHMAVEEILTEKIGDAGKRLHTARSRNDQVAVDLKLYARKEMKKIRSLIIHLLNAITELAENNLDAIMPGYTHLQRAQPITFAHWLMAYASMLQRDAVRIDHLLEDMDTCPLGSGALAGTTYPIDRVQTAIALGFEGPMLNSLDGVSDRDYILEALSDLSILMMHLSRFSEEIIAYCSWEFKFIELDDAYATGSSIMPQKKNPDICELVRGKTGRVYGDLMQMLTAMKGLPLAYNKDMQEDKESFFDAVDTVKMCLRVFKPMLETMTVLRQNMEKAARKGFINATDMADYLTKKGMPFRDAYKATGKAVAYAIKKDAGLNDLSLEELKAFSPLFEEDIYDAIDLLTCVNARQSLGGPSPEAVRMHIDEMNAWLEDQD